MHSSARRIGAVAVVFGLLAAWWLAPSSGAAAGTDTLRANEALGSEQSIRSANGYVFVMQGDGNAVIYKPTATGRTAIWATGTAGRSNSHIIMQGDGNLVVYSNGRAVWASGMKGAGSYLTMQTDGNLVMYRPQGSGRVAVWASNTAQVTPPATTTPAATVVLVASYNQAGGNSSYTGGWRAKFVPGTALIANQEVCELRYTSRLLTGNRDGVVDPQPMTRSFGKVKDGCYDSGPGYGNGVRATWSGAPEPARTTVFTQRDAPTNDKPIGDQRGAVCQRGVVAGRWTTFCSAHLSNGSGTAIDDIRRSQQKDLLAFVTTVRRAGDVVVVAGDFNSKPASVMAQNSLGLVRATPTTSIDQIWANVPVVSTYTATPCAPATTCSDHQILYASLRFR